MRCTSASISSAIASAMVVLPRPDSPTKISAAFLGLAANPARMRFGLSRPIKSAIRLGRYFSARGCGKASELCGVGNRLIGAPRDRKSTRLNSSHLVISYAVFCLKKKNKQDEVHILEVKEEEETVT